LALDDSIEDAVNKDFSVRLKGDIASEKKSIKGLFKGSKLLLVPCFLPNGVHPVLQSVDGEYVLRQYGGVPPWNDWLIITFA